MEHYNEIQQPRKRNSGINLNMLCEYFGTSDLKKFQTEHKNRVEERLRLDSERALWSRSIVVGSANFVDKIKKQLGVQAKGGSVVTSGEITMLREPESAYRTAFGG